MKKKLVKLAETTLMILNNKSWSSITFDEIIKKANINEKNFIDKINNKNDVLKNINRYFDLKLKKISKNLDQSTSKDMIFELIMMRFDILQNYRKSILNIFDFFIKKPQQFIFLLPSFIESMILLVSLAKIKSNGIQSNIQIKGLLIVYFSSFLVWRNDNTTSLEKTMTSLDTYLNRANKIINLPN